MLYRAILLGYKLWQIGAGSHSDTSRHPHALPYTSNFHVPVPYLHGRPHLRNTGFTIPCETKHNANTCQAFSLDRKGFQVTQFPELHRYKSCARSVPVVPKYEHLRCALDSAPLLQHVSRKTTARTHQHTNMHTRGIFSLFVVQMTLCTPSQHVKLSTTQGWTMTTPDGNRSSVRSKSGKVNLYGNLQMNLLQRVVGCVSLAFLFPKHFLNQRGCVHALSCDPARLRRGPNERRFSSGDSR